MPFSLIRLPLATLLRLESLGSRRSLAATLPCSQRHGLGMIAREPVSEAWFSANSTQRLTRFCFPPPLLRLAWPLQLNIGLFCFNDQETSSIQRVASRLVTHITLSLAWRVMTVYQQFRDSLVRRLVTTTIEASESSGSP